MEIQKNSYLNRAIDCNSFECRKPSSQKTIENPNIDLWTGTNSPPPSYSTQIRSVHFDRQTHLLTLEIEHDGPQDAAPAFYPFYWFAQNPSSKGYIFVLVHQENNIPSSSKKQVKATFDLNDPKYAPFLERFTTDEFKIWFVDSEDNFLTQILSKPGTGRPPAQFTTYALGEEGQDGGFIRPGQITTKALGEEGQDGSIPLPSDGYATTLAIGEEGQDGGICRRPINDVTTMALGEEGQENCPSNICKE